MTLPAPYYDDGSVTIYHGDALDVLAELDAASVQCCITSPPYWGLRRYAGQQERTWGDDPSCAHEWQGLEHSGMSGGPSPKQESNAGTRWGPSTSRVCLRCGAWHGAYGNEPTILAYVRDTVEVLRAIRRVLRDDGLCFLNLGDSFFSGGKHPIQSHQPRRVGAYGTDGTGLGCCLPPDCVCPYQHGAHPDGTPFHLRRNEHIPLRTELSSRLDVRTTHDNEPLNCGTSSRLVSPADVQGSTTPSSNGSGQDVSAHAVSDSALQFLPLTSACDAGPCEHMGVTQHETPIASAARQDQHYGTHGNGVTDDALAYHNRDRVSDCASCPYSSIVSHHGHKHLKHKNLCLIPQRVAIAAQDDGWYVRSIIIWAKTAPMPESVGDRPTTAHEYVLMLSKQPRYYYDAEAVREESSHQIGQAANFARSTKEDLLPGQYSKQHRPNRASTTDNGHRNLRTVWTLGPEPFTDWGGVEHFATFPPELPRRCILSATSDAGNCSQCGRPWARVMKRSPSKFNVRVRDAKAGKATAQEGYRASEAEIANYEGDDGSSVRVTLGWRPTCQCQVPSAPAIVLDPFGGSGTTGAVAKSLGRRAILIDRSEEYCAMAARRVQAVPMPMRLEAGS